MDMPRTRHGEPSKIGIYLVSSFLDDFWFNHTVDTLFNQSFKVTCLFAVLFSQARTNSLF